jgi:hypothetical protein
VHKKDRLIASCKSWREFWDRAKDLPPSVKGAAFERLTQLYLQTEPEYRTKLKHVWLLGDVPPAISKRLNLPPVDEGIDLIACTRDGEYWAIQSKFRSESDKPLTRRELGTFTSNNIDFALVAHTSSKPVSKRRLMRDTAEIGLDRWEALDRDAWALIVANLKGKTSKPNPPSRCQIVYTPAPNRGTASLGQSRNQYNDPAASVCSGVIRNGPLHGFTLGQPYKRRLTTKSLRRRYYVVTSCDNATVRST